ncbi:MAG: hypothetical protein RBU30_14905 [Polyangia bacterium]|jgi:hypothetical protein|nr:hypothetical protein [Polyangia bacterium]
MNPCHHARIGCPRADSLDPVSFGERPLTLPSAHSGLSSDLPAMPSDLPDLPSDLPTLSSARSGLPIVFLGLLLGACGARPGMTPYPDSSQGAHDAGLPDSQARDALPLPDAALIPVHCTWAPGAMVQVTEPPNDKAVHSLVLSEGSMLLGYKTTNPDPPADNNHYLQRLDLLGAPQGERQAIFPPPGGWNHGHMGLAAGLGHQGAVVWDDARGCRFRLLDAMGTPVAETRGAGADRCASLRATETGFSFFAVSMSAAGTNEWRLVNLDAQGAISSESAPIPAVSNGAFWWASVRLQDGSFVVAGMDKDLEPTVIRSQHIDALGAPLSEPAVLAQLTTSSSAVALEEAGDGLLVGWLSSDQANDSTQRRRLTLQRLDLQGRPVSEPFQPLGSIFYRDASWSMRRRGEQILASLVAADELVDPYGDATSVVLLPLGLSGALDDPPVTLGSLRFARRPALRVTPHGILVAFTGILGVTPHQIFAVPAACLPDHPAE